VDIDPRWLTVGAIVGATTLVYALWVAVWRGRRDFAQRPVVQRLDALIEEIRALRRDLKR
jgi:hypothetical protein